MERLAPANFDMTKCRDCVAFIVVRPLAGVELPTVDGLMPALVAYPTLPKTNSIAQYNC
jgi:hypothetical protein